MDIFATDLNILFTAVDIQICGLLNAIRGGDLIFYGISPSCRKNNQ